jgi:hypothetical protein
MIFFVTYTFSKFKILRTKNINLKLVKLILWHIEIVPILKSNGTTHLIRKKEIWKKKLLTIYLRPYTLLSFWNIINLNQILNIETLQVIKFIPLKKYIGNPNYCTTPMICQKYINIVHPIWSLFWSCVHLNLFFHCGLREFKVNWPFYNCTTTKMKIINVN